MKKFGLFFLTVIFSLAIVNNTLGYVIEAVSFDDGPIVAVEVAMNAEELRRGLSNKDSIQERSGMLFILDFEERHSFWMKDMSFPVDIIWIDSNLRVVDITENAMPCLENPCPSFTPSSAARYVLEVPSGFSRDRGINLGQGMAFVRSTSFQ